MKHTTLVAALSFLAVGLVGNHATHGQEAAPAPPGVTPQTSPSDVSGEASADDAQAAPQSQPRVAPQPQQASPQTARSANTDFVSNRPYRTMRRSSTRLTRAPAMFGDFFAGDTIEADTGIDFLRASLPLAAGGQRVKVSDNNHAVPQDRVFFAYHAFSNANQVTRSPAFGLPPLVSRHTSQDRYTFAVEKTFHDGMASVELRMPFGADFDVTSADYVMDSGRVGNLTVILKALLLMREDYALTAGLGIDTPTGSGVDGALPLLGGAFRVDNTAVHLLPFMGLAWAPNDLYFMQFFTQFDIATNGNDVAVFGTGPTSFGSLNPQNLVHVDLEMGRWLYHGCGCVSGIAGVLEFHYTGTLQESDFAGGPVAPGFVFFGNPANRYDVWNLTVGLHTELASGTQLRVAGAFPLSEGDNRFFDSELHLSVICPF